MAEAIARHALDQGLLGADADVFVASAGTGAADSQPPTPEAMRALDRLGMHYDGSSKPLNSAMIRKADLVFGMTQSHVDAARRLVADSPDDAAKIVRLDPSDDIEDPIGTGQEAYDSLAKRLTQIVPRRLKEMLAHEDRARVGPSRR